MAEPTRTTATPVNLMPLQEELQTANAYRDILGLGGSGGGVSAGQVPQLQGDQLAAMMTQFARDNRLINVLDQSRQAGLYNSSTRGLLANDIMSSAALKAALGNAEIAKMNAQLKMQAQQAGGGEGKNKKRGQENLALALAMQAYKNPGTLKSGWNAATNYFNEMAGTTNYTPGDSNFVGPIVTEEILPTYEPDLSFNSDLGSVLTQDLNAELFSGAGTEYSADMFGDGGISQLFTEEELAGLADTAFI